MRPPRGGFAHDHLQRLRQRTPRSLEKEMEVLAVAAAVVAVAAAAVVVVVVAAVVGQPRGGGMHH